MKGAPGTHGRKIRNSEKNIQSFPYHVRDDLIPSRVCGQCSMRIQNQRVSIATGINLFGRSVDRQLPFQAQRRRVNRIVRKESRIPALLVIRKAVILMSKRNVRYQSDLFPDPVCPSLLLFSRETCSILVDQSYYHAPYLGHSKDVLNFAAQNLLEKSIRRFVEVFSSNRKTILSTEITIFRLHKYFFKGIFSNFNAFDA